MSVWSKWRRGSYCGFIWNIQHFCQCWICFFEGRRFFFCAPERHLNDLKAAAPVSHRKYARNTEGACCFFYLFIFFVYICFMDVSTCTKASSCSLLKSLSQMCRCRFCSPHHPLYQNPPPSLTRDSTQPSFHALVIPPGLLQHPSWLRSQSTL